MSARLEDIGRTRRALAEAERHAEECEAEAVKQAERAEALHEQAESLKKCLVTDRVEAAGGSKPNIRVSDVLEKGVDAEAADVLADQLASRAARARKAAESAAADLNVAVRRYALDAEAHAISDVDRSLAALAAACARAIAAAKVARDHGDTRDRNSLSVSDMFGSAGKLVAELNGIKWPTYPTPIHHHGFQSQWRGRSPSQFPGVEETAAELMGRVGGS